MMAMLKAKTRALKNSWEKIVTSPRKATKRQRKGEDGNVEEERQGKGEGRRR